MTKINKKDIINRISEEAYLSIKDSKSAVDLTFDIILESLLNGEDVDIANYGSFKLKEKKETTGTNPRTHEVIKIKGRKMISFKPAASITEKLK